MPIIRKHRDFEISLCFPSDFLPPIRQVSKYLTIVVAFGLLALLRYFAIALSYIFSWSCIHFLPFLSTLCALFKFRALSISTIVYSPLFSSSQEVKFDQFMVNMELHNNHIYLIVGRSALTSRLYKRMK